MMARSQWFIWAQRVLGIAQWLVFAWIGIHVTSYPLRLELTLVVLGIGICLCALGLRDLAGAAHEALIPNDTRIEALDVQ